MTDIHPLSVLSLVISAIALLINFVAYRRSSIALAKAKASHEAALAAAARAGLLTPPDPPA